MRKSISSRYRLDEKNMTLAPGTSSGCKAVGEDEPETWTVSKTVAVDTMELARIR